jgi:hypothetical protein
MYCIISYTTLIRSKNSCKPYYKKLTLRHNCVKKFAMNILPTTFHHAPLLLLASVPLLASLFLLIFLLLLVFLPRFERPCYCWLPDLLTSLLLLAYQLLRRTGDISSFGSDYRLSEHQLRENRTTDFRKQEKTIDAQLWKDHPF